ncbi:hypothetical protein BCR33DRAFT_785335 [Rhizoclosmatium globosum]|uniref:Uncharacterized protein n=1 Tax=Rhizoclosmatium globosum TaxID=329046 RepID=A0A1Y2CAN3_9FUNG|nr:hypothetical protein BCR33DRAFT_785335 [Rhizoclosmatium globosum]|eukprot:ORY44092.1 hypothetical protein BCR33DRAFT_785335 [Rhizoclosmatium globosum]
MASPLDLLALAATAVSPNMLPSTSKPIRRGALGPRCGEDGRVHKKRYTPSVGLKQAAIKEARETGNISQTAIQYGVGRSALQGWIKQEGNLAKSIKSKRTLHKGPPMQYKDTIGAYIVDLVTQHEVSGLPLTRRMIAINVMAKYLFFYHAGTHISQNAVVDAAQVSDFVDLVKEWRRRYNVSWHRVINMDQTNTTHGSRATAKLAVTATGRCLPAFVVFKGKKSAKVHRECTSVAVFDERVDKVIAPVAAEEVTPLILILDSFKVHMIASSVNRLEKHNVIVLHIPPGCTSKAQADKGENATESDSVVPDDDYTEEFGAAASGDVYDEHRDVENEVFFEDEDVEADDEEEQGEEGEKEN